MKNRNPGRKINNKAAVRENVAPNKNIVWRAQRGQCSDIVVNIREWQHINSANETEQLRALAKETILNLRMLVSDAQRVLRRAEEAFSEITDESV